MIKDLLKEFKKFTMRGNAIDLAVGVIIGAAFGKIVDSLVQDLLMPPLGLLIGKVDLANFFVVLRDGSRCRSICIFGCGSASWGRYNECRYVC